MPPLLLTVVARSSDDSTVRSLAIASDLVDGVLFATIAAFALAVTLAVTPTWLRVVSAVVAALSGTRAGLALAGSEALELLAPMAFVVLVLCLVWSCLRRREHTPS